MNAIEIIASGALVALGAGLSFMAQSVYENKAEYRRRLAACYVLRHKCQSTINSIISLKNLVESSAARANKDVPLCSAVPPINGFRFRQNVLESEELLLLGQYRLGELEQTAAEVFEAEFVLFDLIQAYNEIRKSLRDLVAEDVDFEPGLPENVGAYSLSGPKARQAKAMIVEGNETVKGLMEILNRAEEDVQKLISQLNQALENELKQYRLRGLHQVH